MGRKKHRLDDPIPKNVDSRRKLRVWVIIILCMMGTIVLAIAVDIKVEDAYKNNGYTKEFENNFISGCKSQGSSSSDCECMYKLLKQNYTYEQTKKFDADPQSIQTKIVLDKIVGGCKNR